MYILTDAATELKRKRRGEKKDKVEGLYSSSKKKLHPLNKSSC